ncbi:MAG: hypothetical protein QNK36_21355 [Colwellia sp.]|nr:hypothetical protein [Colwellia sp.]
MRLEVSNEAEVAFDALPRSVFSAEVIQVLPVLAESEVQANGTMISLNQRGGLAGRIPVQMKITDRCFADLTQHVSGGSYG